MDDNLASIRWAGVGVVLAMTLAVCTGLAATGWHYLSTPAGETRTWRAAGGL
jgi:hypothetical protein